MYFDRGNKTNLKICQTVAQDKTSNHRVRFLCASKKIQEETFFGTF